LQFDLDPNWIAGAKISIGVLVDIPGQDPRKLVREKKPVSISIDLPARSSAIIDVGDVRMPLDQ
jgi:hypothetical protein